jgi:hypothetical protein
MTFTATIGSSAVEFHAIRSVYIRGVAAALNRDESEVHIVSVVETGYRRRLLSVSVLVETQVQIPFDEALALSQSSWVDTMKSVLAGQGITVAAVFIPTVRAVVTTNPSVDSRTRPNPAKLITTTTKIVARASNTVTIILIVCVIVMMTICMIVWVRYEL